MVNYKSFADIKQSTYDIASGSEPKYGGKIKVAGPKNRDRTGLLVRGNPNVVNEALGEDQHAGTTRKR